MKTEKKITRLPDIPYQYRHASVPGGGFVTGFVFHPKKAGILYTRTDIGGVYRYNFEQKTWECLTDHVTALGNWENYPLSIAVDEQNPNRLYIVSGSWKENYFCRSEDRGETFSYFPFPGSVHGNAPGRSTGERLAVDRLNENILYMGTMRDGLFISENRGEAWRKLPVKAAGRNEETNITFVWLYPEEERGERTLKMVVATSGQNNSPDGKTRGESLYYSNDGGESFHIMPGQPEPPAEGFYPGFVGQRCTFSGGKFFVTMASRISPSKGFEGYGCDSGGRQTGRILRYHWPKDALCPVFSKDITPQNLADCGFSGICADSNHPGRIVATTVNSYKDAVFLSDDYGENWRVILRGLETGYINFTVSYMKPEYNGGGSLIHWLSDIKIDPLNSSRVLFNTGTGIFMSENLMDAANGKTSEWEPSCAGLEETVHLGVSSPPAGDVHLLDVIGDLGGFAFADLTKAPENSFADENGNRYITCQCADFPDSNPQFVAVTARGNWTGKTTGGLIVTQNQGASWERLNDPTGLSPQVDELIAKIRRPNTNSGWCAVSADGKTIIWCVAEHKILPSNAAVRTDNGGKTWEKVRIINKTIEAKTLKVLADRINPDIFYGFGNDSSFYVSTDGGRCFYPINRPDNFIPLELGGIDGNTPAEIRAESGKNVVWIAAGYGGLWRIDYSEQPQNPAFERITPEGCAVFRQGMGMAAPGSEFKTLYINGIINGEYGFWRSADEGKSFARINTDKQMYGSITSITGDPRVFGRIYVASGARGVLWGEER